MPRALLAIARGEVLPAETPWRIGLRARNLTDDLQWFADNMRADKSDRLLLTRPVLAEALSLIRGLGSGERWDGWSWSDPLVARHEVRALLKRFAAHVAQAVAVRLALALARRHHATLLARRGSLSQPVKSVLFVCEGNVCRGPFATALSRLMPMQVDSAGLHSKRNRPSPRHMVEIARSLGVDLSHWSSQRVTARRLEEADLIVAMGLQSLRQIETGFPSARSRSTLLGLFNPDGPTEIPNPRDLGPHAARQVLQQILFAVEAMADQLP